MAKDDGGAAFPQHAQMVSRGDEWVKLPGQVGMSLRDYFAGQALRECMRMEAVACPSCANELPWSYPAAKAAYEIADAMIAERAKD